ncbi:MAG: hypothetical protein IPK80_29180 [Nannocystis sp.]|nr:hypothetical protein [Nannocystis sp.]
MRRSLHRAALALALAACGESSEPSEPSGAIAPILAEEPLSALLADPSPDNLLALLSRDHRVVRRALGPHRLEHSVDLTLTPPAEGGPAQQIHDELLLLWAGRDDRDLRLHLRQGPDPLTSRELIILGETVYTRLPYRRFVAQPLDSDQHWLALDEAYHAVRDLLELAAPALRITLSDPQGGLIRLDLSHRGEQAPPSPEQPPESWRARVRILEIEGHLELDSHGIWRGVDLHLLYTIDAEAGPIRGEARLRGALTPDPALMVQEPAELDPSPQRPRYEDERRRLLDGLAR